jgi:hypothetical protein
MEINIESKPPTEAEVQKERQQIEKKIKSKNRQFNITIAMTVALLIITRYINTPEIATGIAILTLFSALVWKTFDLLATAANLERVRPIPDDMCQKTLWICDNDPACENYRQAVLTQGRQMTLQEANAINQWHRESHQRQNLPTAEEEACRKLHDPSSAKT